MKLHSLPHFTVILERTVLQQTTSIFVSLCICVCLAGCDSGNSDVSDSTLRIDPVGQYWSQTGSTQFGLSHNGRTVSSSWHGDGGAFWSGFQRTVGGLWFADLADIPGLVGVHRASNSSGLDGINSLVTIPELDKYRPFWVLSSEMPVDDISNWPSDLGAPTQPDGSPKLYGDRMVWTSRTSSISTHPHHLPVAGIKIGITNFLFESGPLKDVHFVRYDIQNETESTISNVYLGVHGDSNIDANYDDQSCKKVAARHNRAGYLADIAVTYTYVHPESVEDPDYPGRCFGFISGMVVLPVLESPGLSAPLISNRILDGFYESPYEHFGISELTYSNWNVFKALHGLSSSAKHMFNPVQEEETYFAFPGDPIRRTGWFSEFDTDVHSLQTFGPLQLHPTETQSFVVAYLNAQGSDWTEALGKLPKLYADVMANRGKWDK